MTPKKKNLTVSRAFLNVFLMIVALAWLFPLLWALFNSFRDYSYTSQHGYFSFGGFTLDNFVNAWEQGGFTQSFLNSLIIHLLNV